MISILLALAAAQAAPETTDARTSNCMALLKSNPQQALSTANAWRIAGGGLAARECIGLAYVALERWSPAAETFEQAAKLAKVASDAREADFWAKAGNAWIAADEGQKARKALDLALAAGGLTPALEGEVHLDRARASVALGDLASARSDIVKGLAKVPADAFAWYLSAALAVKEGNVAKANADIARALELAPDEPDILLQAGSIAGFSGDMDKARSFYERASKAAPASDAARAAQAALAQTAAPSPRP